MIEQVVKLSRRVIPERIWSNLVRVVPAGVKLKFASVRPVRVPPVEFLPRQDFMLLNFPSQSASMMPNGFGYVYNILKKRNMSFQAVDINMMLYHKYHSKPRPADLWSQPYEQCWSKEIITGYFAQEIDEISDNLVRACPRIIGVSVSETSRVFTLAVLEKVKARCPSIITIAGGYDCVYPEVARRLYKDIDYVVVGEAEITLPLLLDALLVSSEVNLPGVITKGSIQPFRPGTRPQNLNSIEFPKYEWAPLDMYKSIWGVNIAPIISNRGCHWSRCTFCCECFQWRTRSAKNVLDEIVWMYKHGICSFRFNESDLLGDFDTIIEICEGILAKRLSIKFTGELRIDERSNFAFFRLLRLAGCERLVFGVDGWNDHLLELQNKGYTMATVKNNLQYCTVAGIKTDVNMVIGVPGETEDDITECIANLVSLKDSIASVQNLNILLLKVGCQYYRHPEKYNIQFREDKDGIYEKYPHLIPPSLWYSVYPHIDHQVRVERLNKIYEALKLAHMNVTDYARWEVRRDNQ